MYVSLKDLGNKVYITLSDVCLHQKKNLTDEYKRKDCLIVNNLSEWYSLACSSVIAWAKDTYKIEACMQDIRADTYFVLFEQNARGIVWTGI